MRPIDADELLKELDEIRNTPLGVAFLAVIESAPTAEPRKGIWIDGNKGKWNSVYCPKCSVCGTPFYGIETARYHYCPNCGAKMEESNVNSD